MLRVQLTLRGREILHALDGLLPTMESLISPAVFDPAREKSKFRIAARTMSAWFCCHICVAMM